MKQIYLFDERINRNSIMFTMLLLIIGLEFGWSFGGLGVRLCNASVFQLFHKMEDTT